jgi:3-hydroxybutyryl-CoA dehydrogenase
MLKNPEDTDYCLGVVGAGAMGQGIVQVALQGGVTVVLHDAHDGGAEAGRDAVFARLERLVEKGKLSDTELVAAKNKLVAATGLGDFSKCDAVVEAIFEDLEVKQSLFAELEKIVSDDCLLASNTSSILIASIARTCSNRGRVAGLHFFNPVPLMRLVEVIRGPETSADVVDALCKLGKRLGRTPVVAKDAPGFLVNHGGRAYTTEGMRLLHENVATPAEIDTIMRDCCGFRMGPCELMDLTGVDVNYPVTQIIYEGYDHDPRLKTSFPHRALLAAGNLGRKTGAGNFRYDEKGKRTDTASGDFETEIEPAKQVFLPEPDSALTDLVKELGLENLTGDNGDCPILVALLGEDCSTYAHRSGVDYRRLVGVDMLFARERLTLMQSPGADRQALASFASALLLSGRKVTTIADSPGFVAQRICAMVANLGCEMAQIGLAAPAEIDLAMKLGLGYPLGPLELAQSMGAETSLKILSTIQEITGEDRYRPSLWLKRRAMLGLPMHTPAGNT